MKRLEIRIQKEEQQNKKNQQEIQYTQGAKHLKGGVSNQLIGENGIATREYGLGSEQLLKSLALKLGMNEEEECLKKHNIRNIIKEINLCLEVEERISLGEKQKKLLNNAYWEDKYEEKNTTREVVQNTAKAAFEVKVQVDKALKIPISEIKEYTGKNYEVVRTEKSIIENQYQDLIETKIDELIVIGNRLYNKKKNKNKNK